MRRDPSFPFESFAIAGHPKAKRAYGWSFQGGNQTRYITVLEIPPIESDLTTVRAAIASKAQR
jgi:hypothetical protein